MVCTESTDVERLARKQNGICAHQIKSAAGIHNLLRSRWHRGGDAVGFTEDDIPIGAISRYRGCVMRAINGEPALEREVVGVLDVVWSKNATVVGAAALWKWRYFIPTRTPLFS